MGIENIKSERELTPIREKDRLKVAIGYTNYEVIDECVNNLAKTLNTDKRIITCAVNNLISAHERMSFAFEDFSQPEEPYHKKKKKPHFMNQKVKYNAFGKQKRSHF